MSAVRPRREISRVVYSAAVAVGFIAVILLWHMLSSAFADAGRSVLFPSPAKVASFIGNTLSGTPDTWIFLGDLQSSLIRVATAFLLAVLTAVPVGVLAGSFRTVEAGIQPVSEFIRYVPVPALIPLLIVVFGIDESPKLALIYIGTVFPLLLMVADEIRRVPQGLLEAGLTLGAGPWNAVVRILLPGAAPGIWDALRVCNGWAWSWLIVAELIAANEGLGFRIVKAQRFLQTERIFFYLIVLGLIGLAFDLAFRAIGRWIFTWNHYSAR